MASRALAEPARAGPETGPAPTPSRHRESPRVRTALKVSSPGDSAEREAEQTARKVVAMRAPVVHLPIDARSPLMPARAPLARPPDQTSPELEGAIRTELGGGRPLPRDVAEFMEPRFKANFANVRVHTDARAANLATRLGARAFTYGRDIFFNSGQFQPGEPEGMELIAHELTHTIQQREVVQREVDEAAPVEVRESSSPQVQRGIVSEALDWIADKANNIPGYRLFTIVIGRNPINMAKVERSGANILRALIEFIPGGGLIVEALENHGVFEKGGKFIEEQFAALGDLGAAMRDALMEFIDSLGWRDIFRLGSLWGRAKRIFTAPVEKAINFGKNLVTGIAKLVKDAIIKPLGRWAAANIPKWDLLVAVFGKNPISDEGAGPAAAIIGGFMELIGQKEIWDNIQKGGAVAKAWQWFQTAMKGALSLVTSIPGRVMGVIRSLTIFDIVTIAGAFKKIVGAFASFVGDFIKWAGGTVLALLEIILTVVAPSVVPYLKKAGAAFNTIIKAPGRFIGYLVQAGKKGFNLFKNNIVKHLQDALFKWLLGSAEGAGIYFPKSFAPMELLKLGLSVLGLTWANIRSKLVAATNETVVKALETGFDLVRTLVTEGPAAAWKQLLESLSNLKSMIIDAAIDMVKGEVVKIAIEKLVSMLTPAGAFIQAIISIYRTVMFIVNKLAEIGRLVAALIDSIAAIASGAIDPAAKKVESVLASGMSLAISFLANFAGLGNIPKKVMALIKKIRDPVDKALDKVVGWIVGQARKLGKFIAQAGVPHDPNERLRLAAKAAVTAARRLSGRVTEPLLQGALAAIRVRYGLNSIVPIRRGQTWWVRATINPTTEQDLGVPTEIPAPGSEAAGAPGDVRTAARAMLLQQLQGEQAPEQVMAATLRVANILRPRGLKSLEVSKPDETGASSILAEASAKLPLFRVLPRGLVPPGTAVRMVARVTTREPVVTGSALPASALQQELPATEAGATYRRSRILSAPRVPLGGAVLAAGPTQHDVVTWNTSSDRRTGNASHAEHQFINYMEQKQRREGNFFLRLSSIVININYSPCTACTDELSSLVNQMKAARGGAPVSFSIAWSKLYLTQPQATTSQGLNQLGGLGIALSAPADARPGGFVTVHIAPV